MPTRLTGTALLTQRPKAFRERAKTNGTPCSRQVSMMLWRASSRPPMKDGTLLWTPVSCFFFFTHYVFQLLHEAPRYVYTVYTLNGPKHKKTFYLHLFVIFHTHREETLYCLRHALMLMEEIELFINDYIRGSKRWTETSERSLVTWYLVPFSVNRDLYKDSVVKTPFMCENNVRQYLHFQYNWHWNVRLTKLILASIWFII